MNGAFGPVSSRLPGSTITIQCDAGYVSTVTMVTCEGTLMWSPDPEAIECTSLTTHTPTTRELSLWLCMDILILFCVNFSHSPPSNELHSFTTPTTKWHHQWSFSTSYSWYTSGLSVWRWTVPWGNNDCHLSSYRRVGQEHGGNCLQRQAYLLLAYTCNHNYSLLNQLQLLFVIAPAYLIGVNLMQLSPSVWLSRQLYSQSLDCWWDSW